MKQLIGLIGLGALSAASVTVYSAAHQQTHGTETPRNNGFNKSDRQCGPTGELVLLGLDGTIIAREVKLAPQGSLTRR